MRPYAERPARAALQVLADVAAIAWTVLVVQAALGAKALVETLAGPAGELAGAGDSVRGTFEEAARVAAGVPFVGEELSRALAPGSDAGVSLGTAGRDLAATVLTAAGWLAVAVVVLFAVPVVLVWLVLRLRWVVRAHHAIAVREVDVDLLALRALTRRPLRRLRAHVREPAAAWRFGDPAAVHALAGLELAALGLRGPRPTAPSVAHPVAPPRTGPPGSAG